MIVIYFVRSLGGSLTFAVDFLVGNLLRMCEMQLSRPAACRPKRTMYQGACLLSVASASCRVRENSRTIDCRT